MTVHVQIDLSQNVSFLKDIVGGGRCRVGKMSHQFASEETNWNDTSQFMVSYYK